MFKMNFEYIGWTAEIPDFGKLMLEDELFVHVAFRDFLCSIDCSKWRKNFDVSDTELQSQLGNSERSILCTYERRPGALHQVRGGQASA